MNLLNTLTIKNLKLNKKRSIVTIIGIILSVALITAVASMYNSAINTLINFEKQEHGNYHIAYYNVPINEINTIRNNSKVEAIYTTQDIGYANLKESKNQYKPYIFVKAFDKEGINNLGIILTEGRMPENENEILIPTHLKTNARVDMKVGQTIYLDIGKRISDAYELDQNNAFNIKNNEKIVYTNNKEYKIVGIAERPSNSIEPHNAPGYTFITCLKDKYDINNKVDVYARYTKQGISQYKEVTANILEVNSEAFTKCCDGNYTNEEELIKLKEQVNKAKYNISIHSELIKLENNPIQENAIQGLGVVVAIVCGIIVVTSVFCIKNSFDISITEKIKQYGMLRSIGATKKQIRKNVFFEATILGIIGIPLGILFGFLASYILVIITNYFLTDMLNTTSEDIRLIMTFSWLAVLAAIILGTLTIYLSANRSARRAAKISPIESIRNSGDIKIKNKKLKCPKIISKIFGEGGKVSYKNVKRNRKKYRTTVISIVVSVFIFIALSSFMDLAFSTVNAEFQYSDCDINLYLENQDEKISYKNALETTKLDNITDYSIERKISATINNFRYSNEYINYIKNKLKNEEAEKEILNGDILIVAVGEHQYNKYVNELGINLNDIKNKGILIDETILSSKNQNKKVKKNSRYFAFNKNDKITLKLNNINNLENNQELDMIIGCITDKLPLGLETVATNSPILIISDNVFNENVKMSGIVVKYKTSNANKLQDDIEKTIYGQAYSINNISEDTNMMRNFYILIAIFLYGFITVISLIGITNIFNTITTNMELRRPEFAMLKSIGMTKKEFNKMISLESIFIGAKALLFGLPIGVGLSYLMYRSLADGSGIKYIFPLKAIIISIIVVFALIGCIMKYSINKINKQNTIETIRNENI